jgi:hypothetical protein
MPGLNDMTFRALVVALLLLIWLELGGGEHIAGWYRDAVYAAKNFGKPEEMASPPSPGQRSGGLGDLYQKEVDAALQTMQDLGNMAERQAQPASAPPSGPARPADLLK